jgi:hypothetical protein
MSSGFEGPNGGRWRGGGCGGSHKFSRRFKYEHRSPLLISALNDSTDIAKTTRAIGARLERAMPILGVGYRPTPSGT